MAQKIFNNVLVVEDDEMTQATVLGFLKRLGYPCGAASDGYEALQILHKETPNLVISDIMMPGMDGIEFMQEAKKSFPDLDFIIMTGYSSEYAYLDIIEAGAADYMTKPFDMKELRARIARIERERWMINKLKETNEYVENIINSMADSLVVINSDLRISLANRATCKLLEYSEDELLGLPIDKIFYNGISFEKTLLKELSKKGFVKDYELFYKTKSKGKIQVNFQGTVLYGENNNEDDPIGTICIAHDMREVKELQEQVFQSEKMASIGILAAGVAHEIKNPLAIILQGSEFVNTSLSSQPENKPLLEPVDRIIDAALRADKIVKDLLNFSRQTTITPEPVDVSPVIEETIMLVGHQLNLKKVKIIHNPPPDMPKIMADSNQLKQVFINIIVNAVEAMPQGGTITINQAIFGDLPSEKCLRIEFADTGGGIDEDKIQRIFDPFFGTKARTGGTGLGLSVTRGIIEKLNGSIEIKSEIGKGTKVIIRLPYR